MDFPGKIQRASVKSAFLSILDDIQAVPHLAEDYLTVFLTLLNAQNDAAILDWVPTDAQGQITIEEIMGLLHRHFFSTYTAAGASRLPVLALYAAYQQLMDLPRYAGKRLLPLKSHTTSDTKSRRFADIEVEQETGEFFEGVEVKHGIAIRPEFVQDAFAKFQQTAANRFYLLTTAEPNVAERANVEALIAEIRRTHGCEVIVNGVMATLKYYLRLLPDTDKYLQAYSTLLQTNFQSGTDIKTVHLARWPELIREKTEGYQLTETN